MSNLIATLDGHSMARNGLEAIGWGFDASSFAATASPELQTAILAYSPPSDAPEATFAGFNHYLGYLTT